MYAIRSYYALASCWAPIILYSASSMAVTSPLVTVAFMVLNLWYRITSYNVCYTKLLRLEEALSVVNRKDGQVLYNGEPLEAEKFFQVGHASKIIVDGKEVTETGAVSPFKFLSTIGNSTIVRFEKTIFMDNGDKVQVWYQNPTAGKDMMTPGLRFRNNFV